MAFMMPSSGIPALSKRRVLQVGATPHVVFVRPCPDDDGGLLSEVLHPEDCRRTISLGRYGAGDEGPAVEVEYDCGVAHEERGGVTAVEMVGAKGPGVWLLDVRFGRTPSTPSAMAESYAEYDVVRLVDPDAVVRPEPFRYATDERGWLRCSHRLFSPDTVCGVEFPTSVWRRPSEPGVLLGSPDGAQVNTRLTAVGSEWHTRCPAGHVVVARDLTEFDWRRDAT